MTYSREVFVDHIDVNKFNTAATLLGQEREDQGRVEVSGTPMGRTPRLNNETLWNNLEDRAGKDVVKGAEGSARVSRDRDRRACEGRVLDGIEIHVEQSIWRSR
jgi:hypothetical protein